ncbi:hypothetical protein ACOSP7_027139 [Xanthoceras sorbifolium]
MKKDKRAVTPKSDGGSGDDDKEDFSFSNIRFNCFRNPSSKYDFVKVKVWLGDHADHYYVFSRFLLSRMLTVTKIPNHVALKIALELKKLLVDNSLLDVSQSDLEANLFKLMERRGYGEEFINRYKMMTRFHHQRVPLVILVCGTACAGKSTIATQLAQRLNLPNVLQTEMVYELLRTSTDAPLASAPVWARKFSSQEELVTEFVRECRIVRKGLNGDLRKAMKDGKPIIIEGIHLDPSIYLMDEDSKAPPTTPEKANLESVASSDDPATQMENNPASASGSCSESSNSGEHVNSGEKVSTEQVNKFADSLESVALAGSVSENKGEKLKGPHVDRNISLRREKANAEPIIIPIVLKMADFEHKALLEEWISAHTFSDESLDKDDLISNLKTIQDYLCSFNSQGSKVVNISATTFPQTLDWLHGYLLQCIEQGISSVSKENGQQAAES